MPLIQGRGPPSEGMSRATMAGSTKVRAAATRLRCAWTSSHASKGRIQSANRMLGFSQYMVSDDGGGERRFIRQSVTLTADS